MREWIFITVLTPIMGSREPNDPSITSAKLAAQIPGSVLVNSLEEAAEWASRTPGRAIWSSPWAAAISIRPAR